MAATPQFTNAHMWPAPAIPRKLSPLPPPCPTHGRRGCKETNRRPPANRELLSGRPKRMLPAMSTVLVVEDSPVAREVVMKILEREGYDVVGACNGVEAMDLLHSNPNAPDLVLLDVMMPEKDGMTM